MFLTSWLLAAVVVPVAAGLHHVDLPGGGEAPVDVGHRHQPERGPDPVSQRQPRAPLNTTKTKTELEKWYSWNEDLGLHLQHNKWNLNFISGLTFEWSRASWIGLAMSSPEQSLQRWSLSYQMLQGCSMSCNEPGSNKDTEAASPTSVLRSMQPL